MKPTQRKFRQTTTKQWGHKPNHFLWQARKRRGLRQKQVASLLGYQTVDQISRYERGERLPSLRTAMKLELIYGVPVSRLFANLTEQLLRQLDAEIATRPHLTRFYEGSCRTGRHSGEFCSYADRLKRPHLVQPERDGVYHHVVQMAKKLAGL